MARRGIRESARDIENEIRAQVEKQADLDADNAALTKQIKEFIQAQIPIGATGEMAGSIRVDELKRTKKHPLPGRRIYSTDRRFHMIEYGTKADEKGPEQRRVQMPDGSWVTLDRDTPTQALAPFGKARARFGDQIK